MDSAKKLILPLAGEDKVSFLMIILRLDIRMNPRCIPLRHRQLSPNTPRRDTYNPLADSSNLC